MRKQPVLVDSSIWIRFLRSRSQDATGALLESLLRQKLVATTWLIRLELLSGTPTREAYQALDQDLAALHQLALTNELFQTAGLLRWQLHHKGLVIPMVDSIIATCAIYYNCLLLHEDRHFSLIARHVPLPVHPQPSAHI